MRKQTQQRIQKYMHDLARSHTSEHDIATGFALGTFIGILPTPGLSVLLGLLVILIYRKVNKLALFGAMAIWNPLINIPLTLLSYKIGDNIFGSIAFAKYDAQIINQILDVSRRYLLGNLIIAITISIISYFIVMQLVRLYRKKISHTRQDAKQE